MSPFRPLFLPIGVLALVAAAASGCHSSANSSDSSSVVADKPAEHEAAGGKELSASGVTLTFPRDWQTFDMTKGQFDRAANEMSKVNENAEMTRMAQAAASNGLFKMFVFDPSHSKPGFVNNMNLVVTPIQKGVTLDQAIEATKQQLATLKMPVTVSKVSLPSGEFGRVDSSAKSPTGQEYATIGYLFLNGDSLDVATFSFGADSKKEYETKSQEIMKTLKKS